MARILIADDEADLRGLVRTVLALDDHEVVMADDGQAALEQLAAGPIDLLLLDVMMPCRDGWWVLEQVKSSEEYQEIPIIMLTARAADLDRIQGKVGGAVRYVTKPYSVTELRRTVTAVLQGPPESEQRLRAQREALVELARLEMGVTVDGPAVTLARPRLTRLDGPGRTEFRQSERGMLRSVPRRTLSVRQQALLDATLLAPSIRAAAGSLNVSRSYLYAALGRIADKTGETSGPELIRKLRSGELIVR
jgi:DNA-binding response OmpR family regulator